MELIPYELIKSYINKPVQVHVYNMDTYSGVLKGIDVYVNIHLEHIDEENKVQNIIINGGNVMYIDLL